MDGGGWDSYYNSIQMALLTAVVGTVVVFVGAYVVEKTRGFETGRALFQLLAMLPMAIPGMVLGLAYISSSTIPATPRTPSTAPLPTRGSARWPTSTPAPHLRPLPALTQMTPKSARY